MVLVSLIACGCASVRPVQLGTAPRSLPSSSWVSLRNGERVELRDGRVTADSVIGIHARLRRAIPRDSVVTVEARENPSAVPFVMLGALAVGVAVLVLTSDVR
jgi:hypothetical protein